MKERERDSRDEERLNSAASCLSNRAHYRRCRQPPVRMMWFKPGRGLRALDVGLPDATAPSAEVLIVAALLR